MLAVVSMGLRASGLVNGSAETMLYLVAAAAKLLLLHQEKFVLPTASSLAENQPAITILNLVVSR
jgi:hypothetical protein